MIISTTNETEIENSLLVYNSKTLQQMLAHLSTQQMIALDTESNSLFAYFPRVCLLQISALQMVPSEKTAQNPLCVVDYLVDPLRLTKAEIEMIGEVIEQRGLEVVMHAAENDIIVLQREFHVKFHHIFDTQLAARFLGWQQVGLAALLEQHFGVIADKRMQRTNWGDRPLTPQQIAYAEMDTHYLLALRALQIEELRRLNRWEDAQDAFHRLTMLDGSTRPLNERSVWQLNASREIDPKCTGVLQALWEWREQEAQRLNRPPFKIANDEVLVNMATHQPRTPHDLAKIRGFNETQISRYGSKVLRVIAEGLTRPLPAPPQPTLRPEQLLDRGTRRRYDLLRQWRSETALHRSLAPELIFTNQTLLEIAQQSPRTENELRAINDISEWKTRQYGSSLLSVLTTSSS